MRSLVLIFISLSWSNLFFSCLCFSNTEVMLGSVDHNVIGKTVPNINLRYEDGRNELLFSVKREDPVILMPIYTHCKFTCPLNVTHLRDISRDLKEKNYSVVLFSFDPKDGAQELKSFRKNLGIPEKWILYSADAKNSQILLAEIDFRTLSQDDDFIHPNVIYVLSSKLKIVKYLNGVGYTSQELEAAIQDARRG